MASESNSEPEKDRPLGFWARLWKRPRRRWLLGIPAGGLLALLLGVVLTGGFLTGIEATNSTEFCISCHEMKDYIYPEYKESSHYQNPAGVRVGCPDCHVPKEFLPKMERKIQAIYTEVFPHLLGTIDTREKFEAHREEMAQQVWATMRESNSKACRQCHSYDAMAEEGQDRLAKRKHSERYREATGKTCIDCHEGITHELPQVGKPEEEEI